MATWSVSSQKLAQDLIGGLAMGVGYTSGAYTGYGIANTADPLGIHNKKTYYSKPMHIKMEMPYYGHGYRRYGRRRRYRRYRSSWRRRYRRSYYTRYRRYY